MRKSDFVIFDPLFSAKEKWGDLEGLNFIVPWMCYQIRRTMKNLDFDWPMVIHCAYETTGHSTNSYHYKGLAVDFHFNARYTNFINQYVSFEAALRELKLDSFVGMGAYPHWNSPGFHLDFRGSSARWVRIKDVYRYGNGMEMRKLLFENFREV